MLFDKLLVSLEPKSDSDNDILTFIATFNWHFKPILVLILVDSRRVPSQFSLAVAVPVPGFFGGFFGGMS